MDDGKGCTSMIGISKIGRRGMYACMVEFHEAIVAWCCVFFQLSSRVLVDYHPERAEMPLHEASLKMAQLLGIKAHVPSTWA